MMASAEEVKAMTPPDTPNHHPPSPLTQQPTLSGIDWRGAPAGCLFVARYPCLSSVKSDDQLQKSVWDHFSAWGKLLNVKVIKDSLNRPYSFVQFLNVDDAKRALVEAQNSVIDGRHIRVEPARVNRTLFISRLPKTIDEYKLKEVLSKYGPLEDIRVLPNYMTGHSKGCGYVKFLYREDAIKAYMTLSSTTQYGWVVEWSTNNDTGRSPIDPDLVVDRRSIFVGQLNPREVTAEKLQERFGVYGEITRLELVNKDPLGRPAFAFISYPSEEAALAAIQHENHVCFLGYPIRVQFKEEHLQMSSQSFYTRPPVPPGGGRKSRWTAGNEELYGVGSGEKSSSGGISGRSGGAKYSSSAGPPISVSSPSMMLSERLGVYVGSLPLPATHGLQFSQMGAMVPGSLPYAGAPFSPTGELFPPTFPSPYSPRCPGSEHIGVANFQHLPHLVVGDEGRVMADQRGMTYLQMPDGHACYPVYPVPPYVAPQPPLFPPAQVHQHPPQHQHFRHRAIGHLRHFPATYAPHATPAYENPFTHETALTAEHGGHSSDGSGVYPRKATEIQPGCPIHDTESLCENPPLSPELLPTASTETESVASNDPDGHAPESNVASRAAEAGKKESSEKQPRTSREGEAKGKKKENLMKIVEESRSDVDV
ncbi:uncharacterized protein VTP21DRAFT_9167 [Calcarisporiella thermophila]|uniref:uncharacterized protein n=1 Tax=Calcarisporiella thermophila TaxID=911321 RepID=UPI003741EB98